MHRESWIERGLPLLLSLIVGSIGCTDDQGGGGESESETGDQLACDVPQLFLDRCDGSICHNDGDNAAASLDLVSPGVEDRVSGASGICEGTLGDPASPTTSLLYTKLLASPECGSQMPLGGEPLSDDEITCVRDWISGLLPPGSGTTDTDCPGCMCDPGSEQACYGGPEGTAGVGICAAGTQVCEADGLGFGACEGEVRPRGEDCFTADVDEDCDGQTPACSEEWSRAFGDPSAQIIRSVAVDSQANVVSAGEFEGVVSFGGDLLVSEGDKFDIVIAKHDHFGNPVWSKRFGDSSNQYASKIVVDDNDDIFVLGRVFGTTDFGGGPLSSEGAGDMIVAKLDADGNHVWSKILGNVDPDRGERIAVDGNGDLLITGHFSTEVDFGGGLRISAGMRDAIVIELDGQTGDYHWDLQIGGPGDDYGWGVATDAADNIVVAGRFGETMDLAGNLVSAGDIDIYLAKLDGDGVPLWSTSFGGSGPDGAHDVAVDPVTGDIALIGFMSASVDFGGGALDSAGGRDIFIASFDQDGNHRWSANYGDALDQFDGTYELNTWMGVEVDDDGSVWLGGTLQGLANFGGSDLDAGDMNPDVLFVHLDADGGHIESRDFGGAGTDLGMDIALTDGYFVLCGRTYGSAIDFGAAGVINTAGNADAFIAKLAK